MKSTVKRNEVAQTADIMFEWKGRKCTEKISEFKLANIVPLELKHALNKVSAKYAYYGSLYADVIEMIDSHKTDFDLWYVPQYSQACAELGPKVTEGAKKNHIYLENPDVVKEYHTTLNKLTAAKAKVKAIVEAYEMQSRTLQTIAAIMRQELAVLKSGGGSLLEE